MWIDFILMAKSLADGVKDFKKNERETLSELFDATADILISIAKSFKDGEFPHNHVSAMKTISGSVERNLGNIVKRNRIESIVKLYEPFVELTDEWEREDREQVIVDLLEAAGEFRGLGILFRI